MHLVGPYCLKDENSRSKQIAIVILCLTTSNRALFWQARSNCNARRCCTPLREHSRNAIQICIKTLAHKRRAKSSNIAPRTQVGITFAEDYHRNVEIDTDLDCVSKR